MSRNKNDHNDGYISHRAYANPTEDQAIANVMREEARRKRMECRQREKGRRDCERSRLPGGVWHAGD